MGYKIYAMVHAACFMVHGACSKEHRKCFMVYRTCSMDYVLGSIEHFGGAWRFPWNISDPYEIPLVFEVGFFSECFLVDFDIRFSQTELVTSIHDHNMSSHTVFAHRLPLAHLSLAFRCTFTF